MEDSESGFEGFCERLDTLRGQPSFYRTRQGLTERIMQRIGMDKKHRMRGRLKELVTPVALVGTLFFVWLFISRTSTHH